MLARFLLPDFEGALLVKYVVMSERSSCPYYCLYIQSPALRSDLIASRSSHHQASSQHLRIVLSSSLSSGGDDVKKQTTKTLLRGQKFLVHLGWSNQGWSQDTVAILYSRSATRLCNALLNSCKGQMKLLQSPRQDVRAGDTQQLSTGATNLAAGPDA